jgi:hypothetical protein
LKKKTNNEDKKDFIFKNTKLEKTCLGRMMIEEMLKSYLSITMREGMFHYNILGLNLKGIK